MFGDESLSSRPASNGGWGGRGEAMEQHLLSAIGCGLLAGVLLMSPFVWAVVVYGQYEKPPRGF